MADTTADGIGGAVAEVLAAVEGGRPPSPDDLRRRFPDWADDLLDLLPGADPVGARLDPLRDRTAAEVLPCGPGCRFGGCSGAAGIRVRGWPWMLRRPPAGRW